jgi:hypothetical protein
MIDRNRPRRITSRFEHCIDATLPASPRQTPIEKPGEPCRAIGSMVTGQVRGSVCSLRNTWTWLPTGRPGFSASCQIGVEMKRSRRWPMAGASAAKRRPPRADSRWPCCPSYVGRQEAVAAVRDTATASRCSAVSTRRTMIHYFGNWSVTGASRQQRCRRKYFAARP